LQGFYRQSKALTGRNGGACKQGPEILLQAVTGRSEVPIFQSWFRKISNFVEPEKSQVRPTVFTGFGGRMRVRGFAGIGKVATARRSPRLVCPLHTGSPVSDSGSAPSGRFGSIFKEAEIQREIDPQPFRNAKHPLTMGYIFENLLVHSLREFNHVFLVPGWAKMPQ
jgi:hypothetical protein